MGLKKSAEDSIKELLSSIDKYELIAQNYRNQIEHIETDISTIKEYEHMYSVMLAGERKQFSVVELKTKIRNHTENVWWID